ncbi:branched-chain amino acid ABC transporter permease [Nocardioides zeae]|uniref:Branched-chain amino acid ABC transporter permease n=1 Tax=Nocardioides imazamoxiresistens TaxID=3231893 RepID=A0ABU3PSK3_9ACTN|nr:branched-chain amino acid ABC transporter permease [Nocardioides zeae]MDT9592210.1 branched-chain amino acid ABC transporter permease [Nocardioides zeae]
MLQQLVNAGALGSIYTLFALGLTLSWGIVNILNLAHGAIFTAGTVVAYLLTRDLDGLPLPVVVLAAAAVCALISMLIEALVFEQIRKRSRNELDTEMRTLIASVAAAAMLVTVAAVVSHHQPYALPGSLMERVTWEVGPVRITNVQVVVLVSALVLAAALTLFVQRSKYGRALRAIAFDRTAAGLSGVSARSLQLAAMGLSGALAGTAGVLLAVYLGAADAHMGDAYLLKAFAIIILAGVGSLGGTVAFAYVLAVVETLVGYWAGADLRDAVAFGLIIVVLLVRPQGFTARGGWQRA